MVDMPVIVRPKIEAHCASIIGISTIMPPEGSDLVFDHRHNAALSVVGALRMSPKVHAAMAALPSDI